MHTKYTHTHTHALMQLNADTHMYTHTFTQLTLSYTFTHSHTYTHFHTLVHSQILPFPHSHSCTHTFFHTLHHTLTHEHTAYLLPPHTCSHSHTPTHSLTHKDKHTLTPPHTPPPTHTQFLPSHRLCLRLKHGRNRSLYYRCEDKAWEVSWGVPLASRHPGPWPWASALPPQLLPAWLARLDPKGNVKKRKWLSIRLNWLAFLAAPNPTFRSQILPPGISSFLLNIFCMVTWISSCQAQRALAPNTRRETEWKNNKSLGITME